MTRRARSAGSGENEQYELLAPGRVEKVRRMLPPLDAEWARVRISYCGLCGSDLSRYLGYRRARYPLSMGHEWVGLVEAVGRDVRSVTPGEIVTTDLNFRCGRCPQCAAGRSHLCEQGQSGRFSNRGFAWRADVHASYLYVCQQQPSPCLALAEPLSCALHGISHCQVSVSDRVLVVGAGGLGLCLAFALATLPAGEVEVVERHPARRAGLSAVTGDVARCAEEPSGHYDVVLDVSGTAAGLRDACEAVQRGGRLCSMSHLADGTSAEFLLDELRTKDVALYLSYLDGGPENMRTAVSLLQREWTPEWDTLLDVRGLDELPLAFATRSTARANKTVISAATSLAGDAPEAA